MNTNQCTGWETPVDAPWSAEAYVPEQYLCSLFGEEEGLVKGTVFPQLYRPLCTYYSRKYQKLLF
jgi:hypothetical protein